MTTTYAPLITDPTLDAWLDDIAAQLPAAEPQIVYVRWLHTSRISSFFLRDENDVSVESVHDYPSENERRMEVWQMIQSWYTFHKGYFTHYVQPEFAIRRLLMAIRCFAENYPDVCPNPDCGESCNLEGDSVCFECLHKEAPETDYELCANCGASLSAGEHWLRVDVDHWICKREKEGCL